MKNEEIIPISGPFPPTEDESPLCYSKLCARSSTVKSESAALEKSFRYLQTLFPGNGLSVFHSIMGCMCANLMADGTVKHGPSLCIWRIELSQGLSGRGVLSGMWQMFLLGDPLSHHNLCSQKSTHLRLHHP